MGLETADDTEDHLGGRPKVSVYAPGHVGARKSSNTTLNAVFTDRETRDWSAIPLYCRARKQTAVRAACCKAD